MGFAGQLQVAAAPPSQGLSAEILERPSTPEGNSYDTLDWLVAGGGSLLVAGWLSGNIPGELLLWCLSGLIAANVLFRVTPVDWRVAALVMLIASFVTIGCSREASFTLTPVATSTPLPTSTMPADPRIAHRVRAEEAFGELRTDGWAAFYPFTSPRFRENCPLEAYVVGKEAELAAVLPQEEPARVNWNIRDSTVNDTVEGTVFSEILAGEQAIPFPEGGQRWVFLNGSWWQEDPDWQQGC